MFKVLLLCMLLKVETKASHKKKHKKETVAVECISFREQIECFKFTCFNSCSVKIENLNSG